MLGSLVDTMEGAQQRCGLEGLAPMTGLHHLENRSWLPACASTEPGPLGQSSVFLDTFFSLYFVHPPAWILVCNIWFYFNHIFVFNPNMSSALFHPFSLTLYLIRCSPYKGAQHLKCETTETFVFLQLAIKFFGGCNHLQIQGVFF